MRCRRIMRNFAHSCDRRLNKRTNPVSSSPMQNSITSLDHYEFIRISGADTLKFLQGQVSCNTELLSAGVSLTGALCNLKGRVIADFRLLAVGEDCLMQCAEHMASPILATLSKYAVFSKVRLERLDPTAEAQPAVLGACGEAVDAAMTTLGIALPASRDGVSAGPDCRVIRLPGPTRRVELWFHSDRARANFLTTTDCEYDAEGQAWLRAEIESGVIHVTEELSEEYTPQLLNYDISGLIDFKKGCYTGQEIVARMYYRGTAKKRLYLVSSSEPVSAESRLVFEGGAEGAGGEILRCSVSEAPALMLAILASDEVESGRRLQLSDRPGSQLSVRSLPYAESPKGVVDAD